MPKNKLTKNNAQTAGRQISPSVWRGTLEAQFRDLRFVSGCRFVRDQLRGIFQSEFLPQQKEKNPRPSVICQQFYWHHDYENKTQPRVENQALQVYRASSRYNSLGSLEEFFFPLRSISLTKNSAPPHYNYTRCTQAWRCVYTTLYSLSESMECQWRSRPIPHLFGQSFWNKWSHWSAGTMQSGGESSQAFRSR